jgi:HK97 family phage major capsid protein
MTISSTRPGIAFARFAKSIAMAKGDHLGAQAYAEGQPWRDTPMVPMSLKAAVTAQSMADMFAATAGVTSGFVEMVRAATIIGRLSLRPALLNTRMLVGSGTAAASFVAEGIPKPVTAATFTAQTLTPRKCVGLAVVTRETVQLSTPAAENLLLDELRRAVVSAIDVGFIDPTRAGSVTFGAPTVTSTGSTLSAIDTDLRALVALATAAGINFIAPTFILHPTTATYLGTLRGTGGAAAFPGLGPKGGTLLNIPAISSTAAVHAGSPGEHFIALIDGDQVLYADDGDTTVSVSQNASIQMLDDPATGTTTEVSLFQNNLVGLKAERYLAWDVVRSGAVVVLDSIAY